MSLLSNYSRPIEFTIKGEIYPNLKVLINRLHILIINQHTY